MELEELIVEIVIGLFLLFTSYQIGIKENITLLHGYHYTQLDPKDKKVFTKKIGIGTLLVSIGILVRPVDSTFRLPIYTRPELIQNPYTP